MSDLKRFTGGIVRVPAKTLQLNFSFFSYNIYGASIPQGDPGRFFPTTVTIVAAYTDRYKKLFNVKNLW